MTSYGGRRSFAPRQDALRLNTPVHFLAEGRCPAPTASRLSLIHSVRERGFSCWNKSASSPPGEVVGATRAQSFCLSDRSMGVTEELQSGPLGWVAKPRKILRRCYAPALGVLDATSLVAIRDSSGGIHGRSTEMRLVKYGCAVTIFSNFGLGGRFLASSASRSKPESVEWLELDSARVNVAEDCPAARWHWRIHRVHAAADTETEDTGPPDEVVAVTDVVAFESCYSPGHFLQSRAGAVVLVEGLSPSSRFQLGSISLRCAMQIDLFTNPAHASSRMGSPSLSRYASFTPWTCPTWSVRIDGNSRPTKFDEQAPHHCLLEDVLPMELLAYVLSFLTRVGPFHRAKEDGEVVPALGLTIGLRRESARALLAMRQVSRRWCSLATDLVSSFRVGEMDDFSNSSQRESMLHTVFSCRNLCSLSLRNVDTLVDSDVVRVGLALPQLRSLSVGGCWRLTDEMLVAVSTLRLVHLNLAVTKVTDRGLCVMVQAAAGETLATLTLYGVTNVTEEGLLHLVRRAPRLLSLNIRGTALDHDAGQRISNGCVGSTRGLVVLTGRGMGPSIYATDRGRESTNI